MAIRHALGDRRTVHALAAILLSFATVAVAALAPRTGLGDDPFVAGARTTVPMRLDPASERATLVRASALGRSLALPVGAKTVIQRVHDRFEHLVVDEVTTYDGRGTPLSIMRIEPDGRLRSLVKLGWSAAADPGLSKARVASLAAAVARSAGVGATGRLEVARNGSGSGWTATWPRRVAGAPVLGDGTWVRLWPDGSVHSLARIESRLAEPPSDPMPPTRALGLARGILEGWFGRPLPGTVVPASPELAWVTPNDTFDETRPDAPDQVRRLAWVVRATSTGDLAERLRAVQLWIDAGDGRLLGGDVIQ
jgi:hypothetical protein